MQLSKLSAKKLTSHSCGYRNNDNAKSCIGCGTALKPKMSDEELSSMLNRMSDRSDPFSEPTALNRARGLVLYPMGGIHFDGYKKVFTDPLLLNSFFNSVMYLILGPGIISMGLTITGAYVLSRKNLKYNKFLMVMVIIVMIFNGGIMPTYLVVKSLGLIDSRFAVFLPTALSPFYLIIMTNSFRCIPDSLEESAVIDGANHFQIMMRIVIPISTGIIAVIFMFYAITQWNAYFEAMIYLKSNSKYPLQILLRTKLIAEASVTGTSSTRDELLKKVLKYCYIMVSTIPLLLIYPFIQKHIRKGVMVGAIKG